MEETNENKPTEWRTKQTGDTSRQSFLARTSVSCSAASHRSALAYSARHSERIEASSSAS